MDGSMLLAVDDSERHVLTVWQWEKLKLVAKTTVRLINLSNVKMAMS